MSRYKLCSKGSQVPACLIPMRDSPSLFLRGKGPKFSSEVLPAGQGLQILAYPEV